MSFKKIGIIYVVLLVVFCGAVAVSLSFGSVRLSLAELIQGLSGEGTPGVILGYIRWPRTLAAIVAGVGLSLSGVLLQSVMANPLASPNIVGVNAGAGLAMIIGLSFAPSMQGWLPIVAFGGAMATAVLILCLTKAAGGGKGTVILSGVACTTLFQAIISFISTLDSDVLSMYNGFSVGSLRGVEISRLILPMVLIGICLGVSLALSGSISALTLGDAVASSLGVSVKMTRMICLMLAAMSAAAVVSFAGLLGFVGLVVPHITAKLVGNSVRRRLCAAPLVGGILVMLSDLLGRTLFAPGEISVGIVMAMIGAPFFFALLLRERRGRSADF